MKTLFERSERKDSETDYRHVHVFEEAGLGKAPFTYVGEVDQNMSHGMAIIGHIGGCQIETKPGGTCDYCGTAIVNMFRVQSADGRTFKVGCECIRKTGDEGMILKLDETVRKMNKARRDAKKLAKLAGDRDYCLAASMASLASHPHPVPYRASRGDTAADYARWMMDNKNWRSLAEFIRRVVAR